MLKIGKASAVNCRGRRFSSSEALELLGNRRSRSERSALAIAWEVNGLDGRTLCPANVQKSPRVLREMRGDKREGTRT